MNKTNKKLSNSLTLDLIALLAFIILSVSFFVNNNMLYLKYVVYLLIIGSYFLGKAIIFRIQDILEEEKSTHKEDLQKYIPLSINIILIALLLFIPVQFINEYFISPTTIQASFNFEIKNLSNNMYQIKITSLENTTSVGSLEGLTPEQISKLLKGYTINAAQPETILKNLTQCPSPRSNWQRMCENYPTNVSAGISFALDLIFLLISLFFLLIIFIKNILKMNKTNEILLFSQLIVLFLLILYHFSNQICFINIIFYFISFTSSCYIFYKFLHFIGEDKP